MGDVAIAGTPPAGRTGDPGRRDAGWGGYRGGLSGAGDCPEPGAAGYPGVGDRRRGPSGSARDLRAGTLRPRDLPACLRSLRAAGTEAVFSLRGPLPGHAELRTGT